MPRTIQDPRLPPPSGPYCYAFRAGDYIFLGGMPGITTEALMVDGIPNGRMAGETPGRADMEAQTREAIESLKLAVEIAGGKWSDVLRLNLFLEAGKRSGHSSKRTRSIAPRLNRLTRSPATASICRR